MADVDQDGKDAPRAGRPRHPAQPLASDCVEASRPVPAGGSSRPGAVVGRATAGIDGARWSDLDVRSGYGPLHRALIGVAVWNGIRPTEAGR